MKIVVPVKRVIDYNVKARVKADGSGIELRYLGRQVIESFAREARS